MDTTHLERGELIGREDILKKLHVNYFPGQQRRNGIQRRHAHSHLLPCTQVLCGLSGIGKTAIALEYIQRHLPGHIAGRRENRWRQCQAEHAQKPARHTSVQHCYTGGVLQLNLASGHEFISSIQHATVLTTAATLARTGAAPRRLGCCSADELSRWLRTARDWLLVLDNVDDWDTLAAAGGRAAWRSLLPGAGAAGHCLLITQSCVLPEWLQRCVSCTTEVPPLSTASAYRLFKRTFAGCRASGIPAPESSATTAVAGSPRVRTAIEALVGADGPLSGVPLAVEMTAVYAKAQHSCTGRDDGHASCILEEAALAERIKSIYEESAAAAPPARPPCGDSAGEALPDSTESGLRKEHVAMFRLIGAVLSKLSPAARQLCLLLAFLNPDRVGLQMFVIGREALPTELREASGGAGEHGLIQLACELRRFGLVRFGRATPRSRGPAPADATGRPLARAGAFPAAAAVQVQHTLSVHRLVQWSVRSHVTGGCSLDGSSSSSSSSSAAGRARGWPEHWTVPCTLGMLSMAAMHNSRLHNEVHLMPHMLAFYSAVFAAENGRWERESEAAASRAAAAAAELTPSAAGESALPSGAAGRSEVAAVRLRWCFFLDELVQLYRAKHSLLPPSACVLVRREARLLLERSDVLHHQGQLPPCDIYLLNNPEEELTDAKVLGWLEAFTTLSDGVPRRNLHQLYLVFLGLALLCRSSPIMSHLWPGTGAELEKWLRFGKWTEPGRPGHDADAANAEETRSLMLELMSACYTLCDAFEEVLLALLYRAGFPEVTGFALNRAIVTVALRTQRCQCLLAGSCAPQCFEAPPRSGIGLEISESTARSSDERFTQLVRRGVIRHLVTVRYNFLYHSDLPAALTNLPMQLALVTCFLLLCCQRGQQGKRRSPGRRLHLVTLERLRAVLTRSALGAGLTDQFHKCLDLLFCLAADCSRRDSLAQDVKQQEELD